MELVELKTCCAIAVSSSVQLGLFEVHNDLGKQNLEKVLPSRLMMMN